jgi:hypothetical protein
MTTEENRQKIKAWIDECFRNFEANSKTSITPAPSISKWEPHSDMVGLMSEMAEYVEANYGMRSSSCNWNIIKNNALVDLRDEILHELNDKIFSPLLSDVPSVESVSVEKKKKE